MPAAGRMTFGRAETTYFVPRDRVFELRGRGEAALANLGNALEEVLAPVVPTDNPSVWLIRRLHVDVAFAAELDDVRVLAHVWASEVTRSLVRTIREGTDVVHFPTRAAFLAQFIGDAAAGRDTGCWYYDAFDSLRSLPRDAMIREAILREPDQAAGVLFELARSGRLETVLAALHDFGARAICDAAFPAAGGIDAPSAHMIEVLLALADGLAARPFSTPHNAIRLCVAMYEHTPSIDMAAVRAHVDHLLAFAAMLAASADPWGLVEALFDGDPGRAGAPAIAFFTRVAATHPGLVTCAASTLASPQSAPSERVPSAFAGLALLLQPLAEMEIEDDPELRRQIAVHCVHGADPRTVLSDPIMALFGTPPSRRLSRRRLRRRAKTVARDLLAHFSTRLLGFADSTPEFLYANFLEGAGAIRETADATVVELPPVPIGVLLHMAGVDGRRFTVPWMPDRTIELRLGDGS